MSDKESQLDEICVLQSIYTEEEFNINEEDSLNCGQFFGYNNLPEGFHITYKNFEDDTLSEVPISYLPPIIFKFKLPQDYPSKNMPDFEISCMWLSVRQLNILCKRLDELWYENSGTVILYTWTQFLKEESMDYLGIGKKIDFTKKYLSELRKFTSRKSVTQKNDEMEDCSANDACNINTSSMCCDAPTKSTSSTNSDSCGKNAPSTRVGLKPIILKPHLHERNNTILKDPRINIPVPPSVFTHQYIKTYNEDRAKHQFLKNVYTCGICFEGKLGEKCIEFSPCGHVYCRECTKGYFETRIKEGLVECMPCPHEKCSSEAKQHQIKDIIGINLYNKYDDLLLSHTLNMMDDITYCPRQSCGTPVVRENDEKMAVCTACHYVFCVFCKMTYHGVEFCSFKSEKKRKMIEEYEAGDEATRIRLEKLYGKKQLQTLLQAHKSQDWINNNSKPCPHCRSNIEKSDGCNKMKCWNCKQDFCWLCLNILHPTDPYKHYIDPASPCNQKLFGMTEIEAAFFNFDIDVQEFEFGGGEEDDEEEDDDDVIEFFDEVDANFINDAFPLIQR